MDQQIYRQMRELEDQHWWFVGRRKIVGQILTSLDLPVQARILDAGCGTGGNLQLLSTFGNVTGVELDDGAAALARERHVATVLKGSLPDGMPFSGERFDLIVLLDVLEHIADDHASLRTLSDLLAPGGYLVLTVPAFPSLWSRHDEDHHHRRRYRAAGLRDLIRDSGLQLSYLSYFNSLLFPLIAAMRLAHKIFPAQEVGHDVSLPGPVVNGMLQSLFSSERRWIGKLKMPFGVSLLAVTRKTSAS
jgi:SAM-dependent methyltransferase